jgi:hypothetical protein
MRRCPARHTIKSRPVHAKNAYKHQRGGLVYVALSQLILIDTNPNFLGKQASNISAIICQLFVHQYVTRWSRNGKLQKQSTIRIEQRTVVLWRESISCGVARRHEVRCPAREFAWRRLGRVVWSVFIETTGQILGDKEYKFSTKSVNQIEMKQYCLGSHGVLLISVVAFVVLEMATRHLK